MKKKILIIIALILLFNTYSFADADLSLVGEGVVMVEFDSGTVLHQKNMNTKLYPASTTKIMTAILAIEHGKMDEIVTIDSDVIDLTDGSHIALDYDEQMSVRDLLNALMVASANDAAAALAKHVSGSVDDFVDLMNQKAQELGATNTNFTNPSGLHDDNHYTTAYDLSLIARYAMANETFRELASKSTHTIDVTNKKDEPRYLYSTNQFFYGSMKIDINGQRIPIKYDGVVCGKTGYTSQARNCLVTMAERNGMKLLTVVLKSENPDVYADTHKLLNYGFNNFDYVAVGHANEFIDNLEIENGQHPYVSVVLEDNVNTILSSGSLDKIQRKISFNEDLSAPISKGDVVGRVDYYLDETLVGSANIVSTMDVAEQAPPKLHQVLISKWYILVFIALIVLRTYSIYSKAKRRRKRRSSNLYGYH